MCNKPSFPLALAVGFTLAILSADSARAQIGTTVQLPSFGVAVNADGVVERRTFKDPTGKLRLARLQAAKARLAADVTIGRMPRMWLKLIAVSAGSCRNESQRSSEDSERRWLVR